MKYPLLVHHDEEAFGMVSKTKRKEMLAESVQLTRDKDVEKSERVMKAILQMTKPDIKTLKQAYDGI